MSAKTYEDELMAGSDEDSHDAYLEQMKAEGAEKDEDSESSEGTLLGILSTRIFETRTATGREYFAC